MGAYADHRTGADFNGNCWWWLRSPGGFASIPEYVSIYGSVKNFNSNIVSTTGFAVRPALNLNLSSSDLWSNAGTVCSDGTVDEIGGENGTEGD